MAELARMPLIPVSMLITGRGHSCLLRVPSASLSKTYRNDCRTSVRQILSRDEQVADSRNLIPAGSDEMWSLLPGDEVLVHAPYLLDSIRTIASTSWPGRGPFRVSKEIAEDVFEIQGMEAGVPTAYHRSKLKRYFRPDPDKRGSLRRLRPLKFVKKEEVEYEVEEVLDHREVRGKRQYLLQWKGTPGVLVGMGRQTCWMHGITEGLPPEDWRSQGRVLPPELTSEVDRAPSGGSPPPATSMPSSPPALSWARLLPLQRLIEIPSPRDLRQGDRRGSEGKGVERMVYPWRFYMCFV